MCRTTKLNQGPHSPPPSSSFLVLLLLLLLWSDFFRFFTLGEKLGQGATGKVFKATLKEVPEGTEPTTYAVKRIRRWGLRAPAKKALHWEVIFFFFHFCYSPFLSFIVQNRVGWPTAMAPMTPLKCTFLFQGPTRCCSILGAPPVRSSYALPLI